MGKIIKIIYLSIFLLIAIIAGYLGLRYSRNITQTYPYPYQMNSILLDEITQAQGADIVLIGDSSSSLLNDSLKGILDNVAKYLERAPIVYDWGREAETMAQTLEKLKSLKKLPTLLIYHGGRDVLLKKKFNLKEFNTIKKNFEITKDETLMTLIMAYPPISRLIYHPVEKINRNQEGAYPEKLPASAVLDIMELNYQLYKMEAIQLFSYLKERDAKLWVIPQALNLTLPPKRVCEKTISAEQDKILDEVRSLEEQGRIKEAFNMANELIKTSQGSSKAYFIIGNLLLKMANYQEAKKAFYQGMIYDCGLSRSNPIFLKILMEEAERRQFKVIDFNRLVTNSLGRNILFINERDPQLLYYQQLGAIIRKEFLKFIKQ